MSLDRYVHTTFWDANGQQDTDPCIRKHTEDHIFARQLVNHFAPTHRIQWDQADNSGNIETRVTEGTQSNHNGLYQEIYTSMDMGTHKHM